MVAAPISFFHFPLGKVELNWFITPVSGFFNINYMLFISFSLLRALIRRRRPPRPPNCHWSAPHTASAPLTWETTHSKSRKWLETIRRRRNASMPKMPWKSSFTTCAISYRWELYLSSIRWCCSCSWNSQNNWYISASVCRMDLWSDSWWSQSARLLWLS